MRSDPRRKPDDWSARAERLSRFLDVPMAALSLIFFGLVIVDTTVDPSSSLSPWISGFVTGIWLLFVLEFGIRLAIAREKDVYLQNHWFDLLILLVPMLRVLRAFQTVRAFAALGRAPLVSRGLLLIRLGTSFRRGLTGLEAFFKASRFGIVVGVTVLTVLIASVLFWLFERDADPSRVRTFWDALYWSAAIVTTVGSDITPVTGAGRVLAVFMMLYGMTVFGYFVSQAAAWIATERSRPLLKGEPDRPPSPPPIGEDDHAS